MGQGQEGKGWAWERGQGRLPGSEGGTGSLGPERWAAEVSWPGQEEHQEGCEPGD